LENQENSSSDSDEVGTSDHGYTIPQISLFDLLPHLPSILSHHNSLSSQANHLIPSPFFPLPENSIDIIIQSIKLRSFHFHGEYVVLSDVIGCIFEVFCAFY